MFKIRFFWDRDGPIIMSIFCLIWVGENCQKMEWTGIFQDENERGNRSILHVWNGNEKITENLDWGRRRGWVNLGHLWMKSTSLLYYSQPQDELLNS